MHDLAVLFLHLLATVARLAGPGGARSVVAESVLVKHQLLILNRSRKRSPNLRPSDRVVAGLSALFMCPGRLMRSAITMTGMHRETSEQQHGVIVPADRYLAITCLKHALDLLPMGGISECSRTS